MADTIGYRRRKGTLGMLKQLCFDVTGWPGIAVEYFTRISTTQYVRNHLRPENAIVDVHSAMTAVDIGSAFDAAPRTVDVRRIASGRGRYNIPNVGMFVWRLASYKAASVPARYMAANQYTFDPFGGDVPLANPPATTAGPFDLLGRANVPFFLQLYPLYTGLQPYAAEVPSGSAPPPSTAACPVAVKVNGTRVADDAIGWCDLTDWRVPTTPGVNVAVDPVLGRLVFATAPEATDSVKVISLILSAGITAVAITRTRRRRLARPRAACPSRRCRSLPPWGISRPPPTRCSKWATAASTPATWLSPLAPGSWS